MSKVRIYDLSKELRLDPRKVIEDARRLGADVSVPSNSVDKALADRIRERYYPKKQNTAQVARLVKTQKPVASEAEKKPVAATSKTASNERESAEKSIQAKVQTIAPADSINKTQKLSVVPRPVSTTVGTAQATAQTGPAVLSQKPASSTTRVIRLKTPNPQPATASAPTEENRKGRVVRQSTVAAPQSKPEAASPSPGSPQRRTYIPPRDARPRGRHSNRSHRRTNEGNQGHKPQPYNAPRPAQPAPSSGLSPATEMKPARLVEGSTVREFAEKLDVKAKDIVALLIKRGVMATINQTLDTDVAREVGRAFGYDVSFGAFEELTVESEFERTPEVMEDSEPRAPVVTVMGHVDHGKTSLLDAIRATRVAEGEAGGITQHIGAYSVEVPNPDNPAEKRRIVFLDTPGHQAFSMMRARGAKVTDIVVLVVAADDGVMPQTVEAIEHARAASVPIVVAINKIDKPEAQPERVKKGLAERGLLWDGWGGTTTMVEVSAKKEQNIGELLEMILLTADMLEHKANPKRLATGTVLEAKLDRGRGAVATVLVQNGTLRVGEPFIAGDCFGRVRALLDDRGRPVQEAGPATPVEILGIQGVPSAGDQFQVVADAAKAQQISALRQSQARASALAVTAARGLDQLHAQMEAGQVKELLLILKADVQGSVEALKETLIALSTEKVKLRFIRSGVGAITESDVLLASASNRTARNAATVIIGFNVRPEARAEELARQEKVDVRLHTIIYEVEEEIRNAMIGMLEPTITETVIGKAEVRQVIRVPKVGAVAGCRVTSGFIKRTAKARLIRDNVVIFDSAIGSLRRFKDDVSEVQQGFECGITIERFSDYKIGDVVEAYVAEKIAATELGQSTFSLGKASGRAQANP